MSRLELETPPYRSSKKFASPGVPAPNVCLSDRDQTFNLALVVGGTDRSRRGPFFKGRRSRRLADRWPVRAASGTADCRHVPRRALGKHYLHYQGFRDVRLSTGVLPPAKLLARRAAALESVQQLRAAFPGPVEYADPLPALTHLPAPALNLVAVVLLPGAHVLGRHGHVFPGLSLDWAPMGGSVGRGDLLVQRVDFECADVAEYYSRARLAALGGMAGATRLARRGEAGRVGCAGWRHANAGRRAGGNPADLGHPVRACLR